MAFINFGMANTLAQAKASSNKNKLFFPTDSHSVVIDGKEYGNQPTDYQVDYERSYLTFEAINSGTFTFTGNALQYSIDNGNTWTTLTSGANSPTVVAGSKIMWKRTNPRLTLAGMGKFSATGNFKAYGNVMSLHYGDDFIGQTDLSGKDCAFANLFNNCTHLTDATDLILPASTLVKSCYESMFYGCSLSTAPKLPATTLAKRCYAYMFYNCSKLKFVKCLAKTSSGDSLLEWLGSINTFGILVTSDTNYYTNWNLPLGWLKLGESKYDGHCAYVTVIPTDCIYDSGKYTMLGVSFNNFERVWANGFIPILLCPLNEHDTYISVPLTRLDSETFVGTVQIGNQDWIANVYIDLQGAYIYIQRIVYPDISTNARLLPYKFGDGNVYEVLSRVVNSQLIDVPNDARFIIKAVGISDGHSKYLDCHKEDSWFIDNYDSSITYALVQYVKYGNNTYYSSGY